MTLVVVLAWNENCQICYLFPLPSTVCRVGRKPFLVTKIAYLTILLIFCQFLIFQFTVQFFRMVYGLWFLKEEAWTPYLLLTIQKRPFSVAFQSQSVFQTNPKH